MIKTTKISIFHIKCIFAIALGLALLFAAAPGGGFVLHAAINTAPTSSATALARAIGTKDAPQRPAAIGLEITGEVPTAQTGNIRLNNELEEIWAGQRNAFMQSHMASARSINFTQEVFVSDHFVSVVIFKEAISASVTTAVSTTVIDANTAQIITLPEYNINILQLVNNHINAIISANPRGFASGFSGIGASHPFYLDNDRLIIPFGSAELIPHERNIHTIELSIPNIENQFIEDKYFYTLPPSQYNTIMVRLGVVMERFGYTVVWDSENNAVDIFIDSELIGSVTMDKNSYHYRGGTRELEVAPIIINGRTYVPLSFFTEIVGMPTTVSPSGYIAISRYNFTPNTADSTSHLLSD